MASPFRWKTSAQAEIAAEAGQRPLADLRVLAAGFNELTVRAMAPPPEPPAPVPVPAPAPAVPTVPVSKIYDGRDANVTLPVIVRQDLPALPRHVIMRKNGQLDVVIDETGAVESAKIVSPVDPWYNPLVLAAARGWRYRPATVDGVPVKFRKRIQITLSPSRSPASFPLRARVPHPVWFAWNPAVVAVYAGIALQEVPTMRFAVALSVALCILGGAADASPRTTWTAFRDRFPYHIQILALAAPAADGTRVLVISEPPPHVTVDFLEERHGDVLQELTVWTQRVGYDGWVKDLTAVLPLMTEAETQRLVQDLSRDLYGTSYKSYALDLSAGAPAAASVYDVSVGSADLRHWLGLGRPSRSGLATVLNSIAWIVGIVALAVFVRRRRTVALSVLTVCIVVAYWTVERQPNPTSGRFTALHGGPPETLATLLDEGREGVFLSESPGLVALLVRRDQPLDRMAVALREFALDSDLIVGAIGHEATVAVIARERQTAVTELPPLRVETMLQLAAASTRELAQSYERNRLLAGRYGDEGRDWAPIYLSAELHDTEYGSLLNITDQLLKSWSEAGQVRYINFEYPQPPTYPFAAGLFEHANASSVTYNWNTKGVGYLDAGNGYDLVAFTRTGALPVDYLGERDSQLRDAEEQGYEYFAGKTRDPNLARVVQYAGLYQIWRQFDVTASYAPSPRRRGGTDALRPLVREVISWFRRTDFSSYVARAKTSGNPRLIAAFEELPRIQERLEAHLATHGEPELDAVVGALVAPREMSRGALTDAQYATMTVAGAISGSDALQMLLSPLTDRAMEVFSSAEAAEEPSSWIKTPSIVVSWHRGSEKNLVGGHNLSSRISRFEVDEVLSPGNVRVAQEGGENVVFYSPQDAPRIGSSVRTFARNQDQTPDQLARTVQNSIRTARAEVQPMRQALRLGNGPATAARGLSGAHARTVVNAPPWLQGGPVPRTHADAMSAVSEASVFPMVIERANGKYTISRLGQEAVITADDTAGALDAVLSSARVEGNNRTLHLHFRGLEPNQARGFARVAELQDPAPGVTRVRTSVEVPGSNGPAILGEIQRGRWNWSHATVTAPDVPAGFMGRNVHVNVAVPGRAASSTLRMRVEVAFRRATFVTADVMSQIVAAIRKFLGALAQDVDVLLATRRLTRELKAIDDSIGVVEVRLGEEGADVLVVERQDDVSDATGE